MCCHRSAADLDTALPPRHPLPHGKQGSAGPGGWLVLGTRELTHRPCALTPGLRLLPPGSLLPPCASSVAGCAACAPASWDPGPHCHAPPLPPRRRTSYPASQQLVGRDPQRPPVDGVRVPGASVRVRLEHFWGCQRQDRENVTARHSSHAPPVRAGTQERGPSFWDREASVPRASRLWAASRLENKGQSPQVRWGGRGSERPQRRSWRSVNHSARGASGLQTHVKTKIQTPEGMGNFDKRHCS